MNPDHGLNNKTVAKITDVLSQFPEVERVILFGSRAKQKHRRGSDIDLAFVGSAIDWRKLGQIDDALDDLLLPYRFSLIALNETTDREVTAHIRRVGVPFYEKNPADQSHAAIPQARLKT